MMRVELRIGNNLGSIVIVLASDPEHEEQALAIRHFMSMLSSEHYRRGQFERVERGFTAQYTMPPFMECRARTPQVSWNKHIRRGSVGVAVTGGGRLASAFYITFKDSIRYLDEVGWVVGWVVEDSLSSLLRLEKTLVDGKFRPLARTVITAVELFCPSHYLASLPKPLTNAPTDSGETSKTEKSGVDSEKDQRGEEVPGAERDDKRWEREQRLKLELLGDRRAKDIKAVEEIKTIFVARLSPHTRPNDLELVFSRFGTVVDCQVRRATGSASCYAFIQFDRKEACDVAVERMNGVILDDRRIRVDYAHSAS